MKEAETERVAALDGPQRCRWCNERNAAYVRYHDEEWGTAEHDDGRLFELLVLEGFQAGLSWECVLNKRKAFRRAFDGFDVRRVAQYGEEKQAALLADKGIIRNRRKIAAATTNARVFIAIQEEWGTFDRYIRSFTHDAVIREVGATRSPLSDAVSSDLRRRGMAFVGTTIIYSFLQAIGAINGHEAGCWRAEG